MNGKRVSVSQGTIRKHAHFTLFGKIVAFYSESHNFGAVGTYTYDKDFMVKHEDIEERQTERQIQKRRFMHFIVWKKSLMFLLH
jgi:hypothetical protein